MAMGSTQPLTEMSTRSISQGKGGRCVRLTTYHRPVPLSRNLGTLTFWDPLDPSGPVMGLLYLYLLLYISPWLAKIVIMIPSSLSVSVFGNCTLEFEALFGIDNDSVCSEIFLNDDRLQGCTNFTIIQEPTKYSRWYKGDMKPIPYGGPPNIRRHRSKFCHPSDLAPLIFVRLTVEIIYTISLSDFLLVIIFPSLSQPPKLALVCLITYSNKNVCRLQHCNFRTIDWCSKHHDWNEILTQYLSFFKLILSVGLW